MGEFNYKKFLTENKLTYVSREAAFNKLNEDLNKSDFEVGLTYLREMGYNVSKESLNEIKFPGWISNFGKNIKSKVLNKFNKIKSTKDPVEKAKKEIQVTLAKIKLEYPEEWEKIKNVDLTDPKNVAKVVPQEALQEEEKDDDISDKTLKKSKNIRRLGGLAALLGYIGIMASGFNISDDAVKKYQEQTEAKAKTELNKDVKSQLDGPPDKNINYKDAQKMAADGGDEDSSKTLKKFQHKYKTGESDIGDEDAKADELIEELGLLKLPKGSTAEIGVQGKISPTKGQGDNTSSDGTKNLGQDRLDSGLGVMKIVKEKLAARGVTIKIVDQGTNVDDALNSSDEVETGSKEALDSQTTDYTVLDVDTGDTGGDDTTPDDTDDTSDDTETTPKDDTKTPDTEEIVGFYSDKPDFDQNKYMVVAFQILPRVIGNGKITGNSEYNSFLKHLPKVKTLNWGSIDKMIKDDGILGKKLSQAKGSEKAEIQNTIKTLQWVKNMGKKGPKNIENFISKLDPEIKLGKKGASGFQFKKGQSIEPGTAARQGKDPNVKEPAGPIKKIMQESQSIYDDWISLLLEFNIPGYDEASAKNNLGFLTLLYSGIWGGDGESAVEFDNEYLNDKYRSGVDEFEKKFPNIVKKAKGTTIKKDTQTPPKPGEKVKATKVDIPKDAPKPGEKVKATKVDTKPGETASPTLDPNDKEVSKDVQRLQNTISKKTDLLSKLKYIKKREELQQLIKSMIVYINPQFQKNPSQIRSAMFKARNRFKVPEKQKLRTEIRFRKNLNFLIGLISEAEEKSLPNVERAMEKLDKYGDLKNQLKLINTMEEFIEFVLDVVLPNISPNLLKRPADIRSALVGAGNAAGKGNIYEQLKTETLIRKKIRSLIKEQVRRITESDLEVIDVGNEKLKFELKEDNGHYYVIARGEDNNVKGIIPGIKKGSNYIDKIIKGNLCKDPETFKKWAKSQFSDVVEEDFTIREDYNTIIKTIKSMKEVKKDNFCKIDFTKK